MDLTEKEVLKSIDRIPLLKRDLEFLGKFFKTFFGLYTAYKHGFLMYPGKVRDNGENVVVELGWNDTSNILLVERIPFNIEAVVQIIYEIFSTVIEAFIINLSLTGGEQELKHFTKKVTVETEDRNKKTLKVDLTPFRIHTAEKKVPCYHSPITRPNKL